ncbi:MAG: hypothetical protein K9G60_14035, partial [Pseudolabrys sp.]|nr:hypothetical protein [Pseudolabrys sp.]
MAFDLCQLTDHSKLPKIYQSCILNTSYNSFGNDAIPACAFRPDLSMMQPAQDRAAKNVTK